jgi:hypothetical protein
VLPRLCKPAAAASDIFSGQNILDLAESSMIQAELAEQKDVGW